MSGGQFHDLEYTDDPLSGVSTPGTALVSGFRSDISTWAELGAVATYGADLPVILEWYDPIPSLMRTVVLQASTAATDTSLGVQRPDDYNGTSNAVAWFQIAQAGG